MLDGYKGTARCCPTDTFDLTVGTELALERAKVAKANAEKAKAATKPKSVMELVRELEKALPKGQMVVVGNGKEMTAEQKKWLASLAGVSTKCHCSCCDCDKDEDAYASGYDDGYADGYADAEVDYEDEIENEETLNRICKILEDVGLV
jgi:cytochrome c